MCTSPNVLAIRATLEPRGPAAAVLLTDAQVASLGAGRTPAVRVTVNGRSFAGRIGRMGGENLLGFNKQVRADLGVTAGQLLDLQIVRDTAPPVIELPPEFAAALAADEAARASFDTLAPSHRKEYARWVGEAKKAETRERRLAEALAMIKDGRTRR
jgi:bacteriocin resistance YdeI/OmpD-like protein/uncharacterized protein DUF1905